MNYIFEIIGAYANGPIDGCHGCENGGLKKSADIVYESCCAHSHLRSKGRARDSLTSNIVPCSVNDRCVCYSVETFHAWAHYWGDGIVYCDAMDLNDFSVQFDPALLMFTVCLLLKTGMVYHTLYSHVSLNRLHCIIRIVWFSRCHPVHTIVDNHLHLFRHSY